MRRALLIIVASLLLVSGWGTALVGAFCKNPLEHACHQQDAEAPEHGYASQEEVAMDDMEMSCHETAAEPEKKGADALGQSPDSCAHCIGGSKLPVSPFVYASGVNEARRDAGALRVEASQLLSQPAESFAPSVQARQGAPPGPQSRRHILINVFLI
jgi:hypothetical protein